MVEIMSNTPCLQLILVGERQFNAFGSHGSIDHVNLGYHKTLEDCCTHLKTEKGARQT